LAEIGEAHSSTRGDVARDLNLGAGGLVRYCRTCGAMEVADMRSVRPSRRIMLACFVSVLTIVPAIASDNSNSSLEVFALLEKAGSKPISDTPPPPINFRTKPPSLQVLQAQLTADESILLNEQQALMQANLQLSFWQAQGPDPTGLTDPNVPQWQQTVASTQKTLNTVQAHINSLTAQIAAAK
jgi:hypothetical protein